MGEVSRVLIDSWGNCDICKIERETIEGFYQIDVKSRSYVVCEDCYARGIIWAIKKAKEEEDDRQRER